MGDPRDNAQLLLITRQAAHYTGIDEDRVRELTEQAKCIERLEARKVMGE